MILFGEPVTLLSRTVTGSDGDGNDVYGDASSVIEGCVFNPGTSVELVQGMDLVTDKPVIYMPKGSVVAATDRIVLRGQTYEVDGPMNDYRSPFTGWAPGIEVNVKLVTG